jgi:hypothetical protein
MKSFRNGLMTLVLVVGLMGFVGHNVLAPVNASAEEKKVVKEEKAKEENVAKKATAPVKKAKKKGPPPVVTIAQQIVELVPTVKIDIIGTGFEPGQELRLLYTDAEGMQTDIGYALKPEVKANNSGAFFTTWDGAEFLKAKLLTAGAKTITVTNSEFKALAETNIFFKEAPKAAKGDKKGDKKEEKKDDGEKKEKKKKAE